MGEEGVKTFQYLEDLLTRADGTRMTVEEAVKQHYGFRTVWVAALNSEVRDRLRKVRLHGYPPRIFLSYKWGTDEIKAWVRELALGLERQGFEVVLDQFHQILDDSHLNVPRYVAPWWSSPPPSATSPARARPRAAAARTAGSSTSTSSSCG